MKPPKQTPNNDSGKASTKSSDEGSVPNKTIPKKTVSKNPTFNNRHNEHIKLPDGREFWHSRASTVVAHIHMYCLEDKTWYVLLGKRGSAMPDGVGQWNLPCGYLDWDETLLEAMLREVWEECGLDLANLSNHEEFIYSNNPITQSDKENALPVWHITDNPRNKQNISFHFSTLFSWKSKNFPSVSNAFCEPNEVDEVKWFTLDEAHELNLAFNHNKKIELHLKQENNEFEKVSNYPT